MNYRKVANGKSKLLSMAKTAKDAVIDASKKAQEYIGETTEDAKVAISDIKESVTASVKNKLAEEFRKNYPSYVIDHIDKVIVDCIAANVGNIEINMFETDDPSQYSVAELVRTVAEDMVDEDVVKTYTSGKMLTGLFDYIVAYYEAQSQVKTMLLRNVLTITFPLPVKEDEEDVEVDTEDKEENTEE